MPRKPANPRLSTRESLQRLARKAKALPRAQGVKQPPGPVHVVYLGLGSNLGPREKNIAAALNSLEATAGVTVEKVSALYETDPVGGPPDQDPYLNAAARLTTTLNPLRLLSLCQNIEDSLGRKRAVRWGPRTIDLDILAYDDVIRASNRLTLPHPLMHERRFVMEPLAEIAPDWVHPALGQAARDILEGLMAETSS